MKIFLVAGHTSGVGGVETVLKKFNQLLAADPNIECTFFICGVPKSKQSLDWLTNIQHKLLAKKVPARFLVKVISQLKMAHYIKKEKPSSIIAYDAFGVVTSKKAIELSGLPVKLIAWPHFSFNSFSEKNQKRLAMADYQFAICDEIKAQMIEYGIKREQVFTIYNPTTRVESTITRVADRPKFLYVGRVQYADQKNLQELFRALALVRGEFSLDIVGGGEGPESLKLQQLAETLNISEKIHFHGWQTNPWDYVQQEIHNVTALIMTSSYEGFGMVLIEAMSYGIYCISSNCQTGPKEIVQDNINGHLYPLGDAMALAKELQNIVDGKELPLQQTIKDSIHHFYDEQYILNIKTILNKLASKQN